MTQDGRKPQDAPKPPKPQGPPKTNGKGTNPVGKNN